MKKKIGSFFLIAGLLTAIAFTASNCSKDPAAATPGGNSNAPRKPAPASLVGRWLSTHVSGSVINYPGGGTKPTWANGVAFDIHADGTGTCIISYEAHGAASESYSRVDQDCTFEISIDDNNVMTLNFYVVRGKVYENNVFLHDLEPAKCYPAKSFSYTCTFGSNSYGAYFETGEDRFFKQ